MEPAYEVVMEALADMMDRLLLPEHGGDSEAGKAVIRQLVAASRAQFERMKQVKDKQQRTARNGDCNDN